MTKVIILDKQRFIEKFFLNKGICVIGNFEISFPNPLATDSVKNLIKCGVEKGYIKPDYFLRGHRQVRDTACPGIN